MAKMKESYFRSLGIALVEAVEDALDDNEPLSASTVAAWNDFILTVSACMMLAGAGVSLERRQQDGPDASVDLLGGQEAHSAVCCAGWARDNGQLVYRLPGPVQTAWTATEKQRISERGFDVGLAGGSWMQTTGTQ